MCTKFENRLENQTWHWKISQKKWKDLGNLLGKLRQQQPSCREVTWKRNIQDQWSCVDVEMYFIVIAHSPEIQTGDVNKFQYYTYIWTFNMYKKSSWLQVDKLSHPNICDELQ